jgi:hypothetical protein
MRLLKIQVFLLWLVLGALLMTGFKAQQPTELTLKRLNIVDADGKVRMILAGGFPPRRTAQAGIIFNYASGVEAGGLVYSGEKRDGAVSAGGILTFDKYGDDQIVALQYSERNGQRTQGLTFQDRPDSLTARMRHYYRVLDPMPPGPQRDSIVREMRATLSPDELAARRLFIGRDASKASIVTLSDRQGKARLRMLVDSLGTPRIEFLDATGDIVKTVTP